jgi:type I restriction enzyme M protein
VGAAEPGDLDGEPVAERIGRLTRELLDCLDESARLDRVVRGQLARLDA